MWRFEKTNFQSEEYGVEESQFSVGNGYIGMRGSFEEDLPEAFSIRGTYINGLYDFVPMVHAEMAYGFPTVTDRQPRILDVQGLDIYLDGERFEFSFDRMRHYSRYLDFQEGQAVRTFEYTTTQGKTASFRFSRLASFACENLLAMHFSLVYEGHIRVISKIRSDIENYTDTHDPRTAHGSGKLMHFKKLWVEEDLAFILMETSQSKISQMTLVEHDFSGDKASSYEICDQENIAFAFESQGQMSLTKKCFFVDGLRSADLESKLKALQESYKFLSYEGLLEAQRLYLDTFWYRSDILIDGDDEAQLSVRFMLYHLLQSSGLDAFSNISAKGLTGEGYEGHYFWDTETYVIPALLFTQPEKVKPLLEYRYQILDKAKKRALEMGHTRGAAYPWRTISGLESSGYFPAGSAQYHINADIAYAFIQYTLYSQDWDFMYEKGFEVLYETGLLWLDMGRFKDGTFQIHCVTGPDEYTAIVNNNYYTNVMVKYEFEQIGHIYEALKERGYLDFSIWEKRLGITRDILEKMGEASKAMYLPYDSKKALYAQDDAFLSKPQWPWKDAFYSKRPLLLHYHPLTIYRYQILKQADVVLAHFMVDDGVSLQEMKNAYDYYEPITTHDSSLSHCIYGIMASKCGYEERAFNHFKESLTLDLYDTHKNTKDGLHMANMGGTIMGILSGFAGVKVSPKGLALNPVLPKHWKKLKFKIRFQNRLLDIALSNEPQIKLLEGDALSIMFEGKTINLKKARALKGVIFDLDGVLTDTSQTHFNAWKELAKRQGFQIPDDLEKDLRGVSRMESLEKVLGHAPSKRIFDEQKKLELADEKNTIYLEEIQHFDSSKLMNGALSLLDFLKGKGIKMALASASKNAPFLLKALGIDSYFDVIVDPEKVANGKPAPDIFLEAQRSLGVPAELCVGIEDAPAGIQSIKSAGLFSIGIGSRCDLSASDMVVSGLDSVLKIMEKWI